MTTVSGRAAACPGSGWRRVGIALATLTLVAGSGLLTALPASAASVATGTLGLGPVAATAGGTGAAFTFTYTAPAKPVAGLNSVSVEVPSGFSVPQTSRAAGAGYLSRTTKCAEFKIIGVTANAGGHAVTIAVKCAADLVSTVSYANVSVPAKAGAYPFATTFTPASGGSAVPFAAQHSVTVSAGALAAIKLSPATASITSGSSQAYTATGYDAYGNSRGAITNAKFTIAPDGSCTAAACGAFDGGTHTVTATLRGVSGTASLNVTGASADLAVTQTVNTDDPYYYSPVTFTTTVTNTSATTSSQGVSVAVNVPAALFGPAEQASQGSYDGSNSTWTVGTLAPGASATLTIGGDAGDVDAGTQTVTATASAATTDPNSANNTASASEASQPAQLTLAITPSPDNPSPIDVTQPGDVSWTESVTNAENPAAPAPVLGTDYGLGWTCQTASGNLCPEATAFELPNEPTVTFVIDQLEVDTYFLTLAVFPSSDNYVSTPVTTTLSFTTTSSGG
jgi:hypothetical protein